MLAQLPRVGFVTTLMILELIIEERDLSMPTSCSSGGELFYSDEVSGYNCSLKLDIPLKAGETRYLRQLQTGQKTVASGFVGCYKNSPGSSPQIKLIDNPDSCTPNARGTC